MNDAQVLRELRKKWARGARLVTRASKVKGGQIGGHNRWHVGPGKKPNPANCMLCRKTRAAKPSERGTPQEQGR
jgi:hypothetical protein